MPSPPIPSWASPPDSFIPLLLFLLFFLLISLFLLFLSPLPLLYRRRFLFRWWAGPISFKLIAGVKIHSLKKHAYNEETSLQWYLNIVMYDKYSNCIHRYYNQLHARIYCITHACVYTIETKIQSNLNVHNRHGCIWLSIYVRCSGLSMIVREAISNITMMNVVCVLLLLVLASAATKQPPLVTKLSLTSSRNFNQSELLMSSTQ